MYGTLNIQCTFIHLATALHFVIYMQWELSLQPSSPFQMARKASTTRMTQTRGEATRAKHASFSRYPPNGELGHRLEYRYTKINKNKINLFLCKWYRSCRFFNHTICWCLRMLFPSKWFVKTLTDRKKSCQMLTNLRCLTELFLSTVHGNSVTK